MIAAVQVQRSGGFELACSADTAFLFFSPEGERRWVNGWEPRPLFPATILFQRDTVFVLGEREQESIWTIVDVDQESHRAEYVRVAPASHTAHIVVQVESAGPERSRVRVSYVVTAFGEGSAEQVDTFSESAYTERMRHWQRQISACLDSPPA